MSTRLSDDLLMLSLWFGEIRRGDAEFTAEGMEWFQEALVSAKGQAVELERRVSDPRCTVAREDAVKAGIISGKVTVLPTAPALVAAYRDMREEPFG